MAPDSGLVAQQEIEAESGLFKQLFASLPLDVQSSFTVKQRAALAEAARQCRWGQHQTDIRLSLPLFSKRYYIVLLAGEERRSKMRLVAERGRHPFATGANLLFIGATVTAATVIGSLLWTAGFIWYLSN